MFQTHDYHYCACAAVKRSLLHNAPYDALSICLVKKLIGVKLNKPTLVVVYDHIPLSLCNKHAKPRTGGFQFSHCTMVMLLKVHISCNEGVYSHACGIQHGDEKREERLIRSKEHY